MSSPKPIRLVLPLALIAALVLFIAALGLGKRFGADGGTYPDWVAAVATLAAFAAAIVAAWYAHSALKVEQRRDEHRAQTERTAQASLVGVWGQLELMRPVKERWGPDEEHTREVGPTVPGDFDVTVRNKSHFPIGDFHLVFYLRDPHDLRLWDRVASKSFGTIDSGDHSLNPLGSRPSPTGGRMPDPTEAVYQDLARELAARNVDADADGPLQLGWVFSDVAGRQWVREPGKVLYEAERRE